MDNSKMSIFLLEKKNPKLHQVLFFVGFFFFFLSRYSAAKANARMNQRMLCKDFAGYGESTMH